MNKITLRAKTDPSITITGEPKYEDGTWFEVCLAPGVSGTWFLKAEWERVYDLPTVPGTVIRATIRGVPNVRAFRFEDDEFSTNWRSVEAIEGWYWHREGDIDASTVVVELEGDKEGDA